MKLQQEHETKRGFALMDPERLRRIASKGGKLAHETGEAHEWTREEARIAGRKGAEARRRMDRVENDGRDDIL